jgi:hypothetical protein
MHESGTGGARGKDIAAVAACCLPCARGRRVAPQLYTVNLRCLDGVDLTPFADRIVAFDGQHWEAAVGLLE